MWFFTEVGLRTDFGSVRASILPSWGCFWELLGDLGAPLGLPGATLGSSRGALGGSWGSPGAPQGPSGHPSGLPWASRLGSGRVLSSQTTKHDTIFVDFSIIFGNEFDGRCCWFALGFCCFSKFLFSFCPMFFWQWPARGTGRQPRESIP